MTNHNTSEQIGLLSRREAANLLGVDPATIRRYERAGLLTAIRLSCRATRYQRGQVEHLIASCSRHVQTASNPLPSEGAKTQGAEQK